MRTLRLCVLICLVMASFVSAEEWIVIGPRALGMGGAGVALTRGPLATYWNPANLAIDWPAYRKVDQEEGDDTEVTVVGLSLPLTVALSIQGDTVETIDKIYNDLDSLNLDSLESDIFNNPAAQFNDAAYQDELQTLLHTVCEDLPSLNKRGDGMVVNAAGELGFQWGRFALAARQLSWGGVNPLVDLSALNFAFGTDMSDFIDATGGHGLSGSGTTLADELDDISGVSSNAANELVYWAEQAGVDTSDSSARDMLTKIAEGTAAGTATSDNFIGNNTSGFQTKALGVSELGVSYAQPLFNGRVSIGVTPKLMYGMTYSKNYTLDSLEEGTDLLEEIDDRNNRKDNLAFSLDAGVTVMPVDFLAVGVVGRNLTQPRFKAQGNDLELDPQLRAGVALFPCDWLTIACDTDLYKNASEVLPGYKKEDICGGVEFNIYDVLLLRGGLSKNVATGTGLVYHAGLGLHGGPFHLDLAAKYSSDKVDIEYEDSPTSLPRNSGLSVMLELIFAF